MSPVEQVGEEEFKKLKNKPHLKVSINRDPEVDSLQQELHKLKQENEGIQEERKAMEEMNALIMFQHELELLALKHPSHKEEIKGIQTPDELERMKGKLEGIKESEHRTRRAPAGKATIKAPEWKDPNDAKTQQELLDNIYLVLKDSMLPKKMQRYKPHEHAKAKNQREKLLKSLFTGRSAQQLRDGRTLGKPHSERSEITYCRHCGATIDIRALRQSDDPHTCPKCGGKVVY